MANLPEALQLKRSQKWGKKSCKLPPVPPRNKCSENIIGRKRKCLDQSEECELTKKSKCDLENESNPSSPCAVSNNISYEKKRMLDQSEDQKGPSKRTKYDNKMETPGCGGKKLKTINELMAEREKKPIDAVSFKTPFPGPKKERKRKQLCQKSLKNRKNETAFINSKPCSDFKIQSLKRTIPLEEITTRRSLKDMEETGTLKERKKYHCISDIRKKSSVPSGEIGDSKWMKELVRASPFNKGTCNRKESDNMIDEIDRVAPVYNWQGKNYKSKESMGRQIYKDVFGSDDSNVETFISRLSSGKTDRGQQLELTDSSSSCTSDKPATKTHSSDKILEDVAQQLELTDSSDESTSDKSTTQDLTADMIEEIAQQVELADSSSSVQCRNDKPTADEIEELCKQLNLSDSSSSSSDNCLNDEANKIERIENWSEEMNRLYPEVSNTKCSNETNCGIKEISLDNDITDILEMPDIEEWDHEIANVTKFPEPLGSTVTEPNCDRAPVSKRPRPPSDSPPEFDILDVMEMPDMEEWDPEIGILTRFSKYLKSPGTINEPNCTKADTSERQRRLSDSSSSDENWFENLTKIVDSQIKKNTKSNYGDEECPCAVDSDRNNRKTDTMSNEEPDIISQHLRQSVKSQSKYDINDDDNWDIEMARVSPVPNVGMNFDKSPTEFDEPEIENYQADDENELEIDQGEFDVNEVNGEEENVEAEVEENENENEPEVPDIGYEYRRSLVKNHSKPSMTDVSDWAEEIERVSPIPNVGLSFDSFGTVESVDLEEFNVKESANGQQSLEEEEEDISEFERIEKEINQVAEDDIPEIPGDKTDQMESRPDNRQTSFESFTDVSTLSPGQISDMGGEYGESECSYKNKTSTPRNSSKRNIFSFDSDDMHELFESTQDHHSSPDINSFSNDNLAEEETAESKVCSCRTEPEVSGKIEEKENGAKNEMGAVTTAEISGQDHNVTSERNTESKMKETHMAAQQKSGCMNPNKDQLSSTAESLTNLMDTCNTFDYEHGFFVARNQTKLATICSTDIPPSISLTSAISRTHYAH